MKLRYWTDMKDISNQYREMGVDAFYEKHAHDYDNPHKEDIHSLLNEMWHADWNNIRVCDLGCGDGLITKWMQANHPGCTAVGVDKWMAKRYTEETGCKAYKLSFLEFASNMHPNGVGVHNGVFEDKYDLIVCSYAFDLIPESDQNRIMYLLSSMADTILLIRPNRKVVNTWCYNPVKKVAVGKAKGVLYQWNDNYREDFKAWQAQKEKECALMK